jgi:hypothetical protein
MGFEPMDMLLLMDMWHLVVKEILIKSFLIQEESGQIFLSTLY